jgi:hypothetical protein
VNTTKFRYNGSEKRSSLNKRHRPVLDDELTKFKFIYSTLHQAKTQHLPPQSILALERACEIITKEVHKMGMPIERINSIKHQIDG